MTSTPPPDPALRMAGIAPFRVMQVLERARALEAAGRDVVHMEIGEPDFTAPPAVAEAGAAAILRGDSLYTPALGLPALRQAIAAWYGSRYREDLPASRVVVTPGASGALLLALSALVNPGDRVLMADPSYPCNRHFVELLGGRPLALPVDADTAWQPTPEAVAAAWQPGVKVLMLASPSNPTGTLIPPEHLAALAEIARKRGAALVVDEIYHGLTYGCDAATAANLPGDVFVINSFSKYFQMTGWRLGWLLAPARLMDPVERLAQNLFICPPTPAQHAALECFRPGTVAVLEERREEFRRRRDLLLPGLRELGFRLPLEPRGAFYLYAGLPPGHGDSEAFALALLEREAVAVTPGLDFGSHRPREHLRFAYTTDRERLAEALARIRRFLGREG